MEQPPIITTVDAQCATIVLNRPEALNALSRAMRMALIDTLARLDADPAVHVVVLTGAGRAFTAGLDLKELAASGQDVSTNVDAENVVAAIERFGKPLIAAVNGVCVTGGVEIVLACDIVMASDTARFADTHVKIGVTPGWGLSQRLSRLIGVQRAKEMSLSARFISAQDAESWGMVNRVVPAAELMPRAMELAKSIAQWPAKNVMAMKAIIDRGHAMALGEALAMEASTASRNNAEVAVAASVLPANKR